MSSTLSNKEQYINNMIEKYSNMVYRLAMARTRNKEDAEDVFQEVFLKLSKKLPNFESETHEKAWLIRVTVNLTKNLFRSAHFKKIVPLEEELKFEDKEMSNVYFQVLSLPNKYRTIIHLFYYEGFSIKEIATILNTNENTIKTRLSRAREQLKSKLEGGFEE